MATVTKAQFRRSANAASDMFGVVNSAVAKPTKRVDDQRAARLLPRTLMGGTAAMRDAGMQFLPKHPAESDGSYALRLNATTLYNGFAETVASQAGKFYGEPVVLKESVPPELARFAENVDGQGRALTPFMVDETREAFVDGVSFILVDAPQLPPDGTRADQIAVGWQPYWVLVRADDVIGIRTESVHGKQVLTQLRIKECAQVPDGEFGEREQERVRVLEPGRWRVYVRVVDDGNYKWVLDSEGVTSLGYIPLVPVYTNRTGYLEGAPPLRTLAELNQEHWVSSSEQRRALSFLRFAMLAVTGADSTLTNVTLGPDKVLTLPPGADAHYVEHSGAGIASGAADIEAIEKRMASAGMELRVENGGSVTATAASLDSAETNAGLHAVAKGIEDSIEQALQMTADLLGLQSGGEVELCDDFGGNVVPGTVTDVTYVRTSGNLSQPTYWAELKRRGILDEDFDPELEQALLDDEQSKSLALQQELFAQQQPQVDAQGNPVGGA